MALGDLAGEVPALRAKGRNDSYACVNGVGRGCGRIAITAEPLEEFVTGAVLDALESPRVQEALRDGNDASAPRGTAR